MVEYPRIAHFEKWTPFCIAFIVYLFLPSGLQYSALTNHIIDSLKQKYVQYNLFIPSPCPTVTQSRPRRLLIALFVTAFRPLLDHGATQST
jgi:hypothetical protein